MVTAITGVIDSGKSTLAAYLIKMGYKPVLEYTTRPMREGEQDGVDYYFIDDVKFDQMRGAGEFAEVLCVETKHGLWKYGATKDDVKNKENGYILVCGPGQLKQLLDAEIPVLSVLLDIDKETARSRAINRGTKGDSLDEFERRFTEDTPKADAIRQRVTLVLDATNTVEDNAKAINSALFG